LRLVLSVTVRAMALRIRDDMIPGLARTGTDRGVLAPKGALCALPVCGAQA